MSIDNPTQRQTDGGWLCWVALRLSDFWEFIDKRDIDKHVVMAIIMYGTVRITTWSMAYIEANPNDAGTDVGLKVGAVLLSWNLIAAPAIKWYFDARTKEQS